MLLLSLGVPLSVLADGPTSILGGIWNFPNVGITVNFWVLIIVFAAALIWHAIARRRGGGIH